MPLEVVADLTLSSLTHGYSTVRPTPLYSGKPVTLGSVLGQVRLDSQPRVGSLCLRASTRANPAVDALPALVICEARSEQLRSVLYERRAD